MAEVCDCCGGVATLVLTPTTKLPRCHYCRGRLFEDVASATFQLCALDCPNQGFEEIDINADGFGRIVHWDKFECLHCGRRNPCPSYRVRSTKLEPAVAAGAAAFAAAAAPAAAAAVEAAVAVPAAAAAVEAAVAAPAAAAAAAGAAAAAISGGVASGGAGPRGSRGRLPQWSPPPPASVPPRRACSGAAAAAAPSAAAATPSEAAAAFVAAAAASASSALAAEALRLGGPRVALHLDTLCDVLALDEAIDGLDSETWQEAWLKGGARMLAAHAFTRPAKADAAFARHLAPRWAGAFAAAHGGGVGSPVDAAPPTPRECLAAACDVLLCELEGVPADEREGEVHDIAGDAREALAATAHALRARVCDARALPPPSRIGTPEGRTAALLAGLAGVGLGAPRDDSRMCKAFVARGALGVAESAPPAASVDDAAACAWVVETMKEMSWLFASPAACAEYRALIREHRVYDDAYSDGAAFSAAIRAVKLRAMHAHVRAAGGSREGVPASLLRDDSPSARVIRGGAPRDHGRGGGRGACWNCGSHGHYAAECGDYDGDGYSDDDDDDGYDDDLD